MFKVSCQWRLEAKLWLQVKVFFYFSCHFKNFIFFNNRLSGLNGVVNGPDCLVKTNEKGEIRFVVKPGPIQLSADFVITEVDIKLPCVNKYNTKDVRASGSWSVPDFDATDPLGIGFDKLLFFKQRRSIIF